MKFACGRGKRLRQERQSAYADSLKNWHRWFAWHPVKVGKEDCRWLEFVERRASVTRGYGHTWVDFYYRPPQEA